MRSLDLQTLRLFVAVCEQRNIARAAERESIVGSAVSKRLAQLEDTLGTRLLVRRRHGVAPTPAGETLLEHAREMLATAGRIERDMAGFATGVRGHVRMLVTASVMAESLADDVAAFLQEPAHRDIQVSMEERVSPEVVRGVREGSASLGICWDAADLQGLHTRAYRSDHLAIAAHPSHPVAALETVRFADVLGYEFVSMPALSAVQVLLARAAALEGAACCTGCSCRTSTPRCAWCAPTWPSAWYRARWRSRSPPPAACAWCRWPIPGPAGASPCAPGRATACPPPRRCWPITWPAAGATGRQRECNRRVTPELFGRGACQT